MASTARKTSPPDNLRNTPGGKTTWKNGVPSYGWYKMPDEWWDHLARLQRGLYQRMLIEFVWGAMIPREDGVGMPEWSRAFTYIELAERLRCSPEQVRDDARNARDRGMLALRECKGQVQFQILWQKWEKLEDYDPSIHIAGRKKKVESAAITTAHWIGRPVTAQPGEAVRISVPDLPADVRIQQICFDNKGSEGALTISGAGLADGGVIVLQTQAAFVKPAKQPKISPAESSLGESTPVTKNTPTNQKTNTLDPIIEQISAIIGTYGPVTVDAVLRLVRASHVSSEQVLSALSVVKPPEDAVNPVGWLMKMIPLYCSGEYKPAQHVNRKPSGAEGRRLAAYEEALRKAREEEKIA